MKKLENKFFFTIFVIFTFFLTFLLILFNYQNYEREKNSVQMILSKISNINGKERVESPNNKQNWYNNSIFIEYDVTSIILDSQNNISEIIPNTSYNKDIIKLATNIISKEKDNTTFIGNLYINNYAYYYKSKDIISLISMSKIKSRLNTLLLYSGLLFIILELIFLYISKKIAAWAVKPAIESFEKQKNFIADASHELKTPLAVILASSECLEVDKENEKWLEAIKEETERMKKLVTDLLDLSKIDNDCAKTCEITNLSKLINKNALTFESLAFEENLSIKCDIEDNIMFLCNEEQMVTMVQTLLDNALIHAYKNTSIEIFLKREKNNIILKITNEGDEIPKEECEKIFERFYRIDKSRNRDANRYGLGLAIVKSIVLKHNGTIKAYSENKHTTFEITFKSKSTAQCIK